MSRPTRSARITRFVRWTTNGAAAFVACALAVHGLEAGDGFLIAAAVASGLLTLGADRVATDFERSETAPEEKTR